MNKIFALFALSLFLHPYGASAKGAVQEKGILDGDRKAPERVSFLPQQKEEAKKIQHLIVILQESWSFDSLYGRFPGVDGLDHAKPEAIQQVNLMGEAHKMLPPSINTRTSKPYAQIPSDMHNRPFDLQPFIDADKLTGGASQDFYLEQYQINGGRMNQYVTYSDAGGFVMSYYDITKSEMGKLARQYTLCDNWFHSCYGGTMCGALWLFSAQMPVWMSAPSEVVAKLLPSGALLNSGLASPEGFAINNAQPFYPPYENGVLESRRVPPQVAMTIGDRLSGKGVSWKWYAEGWDNASIGDPDATFLFYQHAPVFFKQYAPGTAARDEHLGDLNLFYLDLKTGQVPEVSFIRSLGRNSEHPSVGTLEDGLNWCARLVKLIQESPIWEKCAIIITYDENGGRWDHVAPPVVDRFGPGTRVPALIISPFAKKEFVDHTSYETTSILKFIEERWSLDPLSTRDAEANNLLNAFDF